MANGVDSEFVGQVALVTGGSSGIGFATARAFLEDGAAVAICGRSAVRGRQAAEALGAFGEVEFFAADVTDDSAVAGMVEGVVVNRPGFPGGRVDYATSGMEGTV